MLRNIGNFRIRQIDKMNAKKPPKFHHLLLRLLHFVSFLLVHISFFLTFNFHFWRKFSSGVWNSLCSTPCLPPPPPPCAPSSTSSRLPHCWFSEMTWFSKPSNFSAGFTSSSVSSKLLKEICFLSHIPILPPPPKFQILHTSSPRLSSNFFMIKKINELFI